MQLHAEIHWPVNSKQTYDQQITYLLSNQWRTHMVRFYVVSQSKNKATKVSVSLSSAIFFASLSWRETWRVSWFNNFIGQWWDRLQLNRNVKSPNFPDTSRNCPRFPMSQLPTSSIQQWSSIIMQCNASKKYEVQNNSLPWQHLLLTIPWHFPNLWSVPRLISGSFQIHTTSFRQGVTLNTETQTALCLKLLNSSNHRCKLENLGFKNTSCIVELVTVSKCCISAPSPVLSCNFITES